MRVYGFGHFHVISSYVLAYLPGKFPLLMCVETWNSDTEIWPRGSVFILTCLMV